MFSQVPPSFAREDLGSLHRMLAREFPRDQLAYVGYTRDLHYARFSYERFLSPHDEASLHRFIPHHRPLNASHCATILTFTGAHGCQQMEKKRSLWEYATEPWQSDKCYGELLPLSTFLRRFLQQDERVRLVEPANGFNSEDAGMQLLAPLINEALGD